MSRPKQVWVARQQGRVSTDGKSIVIPGRLKDDPDRVVEVTFPRSAAERIIISQINALEIIDRTYGPLPPFGENGSRNKGSKPKARKTKTKRVKEPA